MTDKKKGLETLMEARSSLLDPNIRVGTNLLLPVPTLSEIDRSTTATGPDRDSTPAQLDADTCDTNDNEMFDKNGSDLGQGWNDRLFSNYGEGKEEKNYYEKSFDYQLMTPSNADGQERHEMKSKAQLFGTLFSTQKKTQNRKIKIKTTHKSHGDLSSLINDSDKSVFSEAEILAAFKIFDLDKNNYIGAKEIKHILMCMGELVTDDEIDMMIRMIDVDGDCHISFIEFRDLILDPSPHLTDLHNTIKIEKKCEEYEGKAMSSDRYNVNLNDKIIIISEEAIGVVEGSKGGISDESANSIEFTSTPSTQRQKDSNLRESIKKFLMSFVDENNLNFESIKSSYRVFLSFSYNRRRENKINYPDLCLVFSVYDEVEYQKLFLLLDDKNQGEICFKRFILSLLNFIIIERDDRIKFIFYLYDESESGYISEEDLNEILMGSHMMSLSAIKNKSNTIMKKNEIDRERNNEYHNNPNNKFDRKKSSVVSISISEFINISKKFPNVLFPSPGSNP